jgi:hypothetical protein
MAKPTTTFTAFRAEPDLAAAMQRLHVRDGISLSEQIRRALKVWLAQKGVYKPPTAARTTKKR